MNIKFLTLNIEHGGKFFEKIVDFVRNESPDAIAFQEVFDSKEEESEKRFRTYEEFKIAFSDLLPFSDFQSSCFFINEDFEKGAEYGNAIFSKHEIVECGKTILNAPYGVVDERGISDYSWEPCPLQYARLSVEGRDLNIYNLHGVWGFDGVDNERRIRMAEGIADQMRDRKNLILAGDTNFTKSAFKTIEIIESSGVKSVFGDSLKSTFNMRHKTDPGYATSAVDMIFVSTELKVIDKKLLEVDVSDHFPLMATIEL